MIHKHLSLGELAARTTPVFVIVNDKIDLTTLYDHVMKSALPLEGPESYAHVRDHLFPIDNTRDTMYYMRHKEAEDALFLAAGQAVDH